jgi:hypothetical protein
MTMHGLPHVGDQHGVVDGMDPDRARGQDRHVELDVLAIFGLSSSTGFKGRSRSSSIWRGRSLAP